MARTSIRRGIQSLALTAMVAPASPATGQTFTTHSFAPPVNFPIATGLGQLTVADVDGDARPDLVFLSGGNTVGVMQNLGLGPGITTNTFAPPVLFRMTTFPESFALADLNGDGLPDLVVSGLGGVWVLENEGHPGQIDAETFGPPIQFVKPSGFGPSYVAAGDLDGDGKPDIIYTVPSSNLVGVLRNLTAGRILTVTSFAPPVALPFSYPGIVTLADLDDDGKPDVVISSAGPLAGGAVLRNLSTPGNLAFGAGQIPSFAGLLVDFDGDGKLDWVQRSTSGGRHPPRYPPAGNNSVTVYLNQSTPGHASFGAGIEIPLPGQPGLLWAHDLDGDGRADFVLGAPLAPTNLISLVRNTVVAGRVFPVFVEPPVDMVFANRLLSLQAADLDGDGKPDLVMDVLSAGAIPWTISILRNQVVPRPEVDLIAPPGSRRYQLGDLVAFEAFAFHIAGKVERIELYQDGTLVRASASAPYVLNTVMSAPGRHVLTARAVDNQGESFESQPLAILVASPLEAPLHPLRLVAEPTSASSYVIDTNRQLYAWGDNRYGQLGAGQPFSQLTTPSQVSLPDDVTGWMTAAAGTRHAVAVSEGGQLFTWGANDFNQLGIGPTNANQTAPVLVPNPIGVSSWSLVAAGGLFTLAVANDGALFAWGANDHGELGLGHTNAESAPTFVAFPAVVTSPELSLMPVGVTAWQTVTASGYHGLGLSRDRQLYAWGDNQSDELGTGVPTFPPTTLAPTRVVLPAGVTSWTAVSAGACSLAIGNDNQLYSWGSSGSGALGLGPLTNSPTPAPVCGLNAVCANVTNLPPLVAITIPASGATYISPGNLTVSVAAADPDGLIDEVDLFSVTFPQQNGFPFGTPITNKLGTLFAPPFAFAVANLANPDGNDPVSLFARATDDTGATTDSPAIFVTLVPPPNLGVRVLGSTTTNGTPNPYTGFYEQQISITNPSIVAVPAFQVLITNLPSDVRVMNATGQSNGVPVIQLNVPIPAGSSLDLTIEYDRLPSFLPVFNPQVASPTPPFQPGGTLAPVREFTLLTNRNFLVEFDAPTNLSAYVQYSTNLLTGSRPCPA